MVSSSSWLFKPIDAPAVLGMLGTPIPLGPTSQLDDYSMCRYFSILGSFTKQIFASYKVYSFLITSLVPANGSSFHRPLWKENAERAAEKKKISIGLQLPRVQTV